MTIATTSIYWNVRITNLRSTDIVYQLPSLGPVQLCSQTFTLHRVTWSRRAAGMAFGATDYLLKACLGGLPVVSNFAQSGDVHSFKFCAAANAWVCGVTERP